MRKRNLSTDANLQKLITISWFRKNKKMNTRKLELYRLKFRYTNIETLTSFGLLVTKYALCKRGEGGKKDEDTH